MRFEVAVRPEMLAELDAMAAEYKPAAEEWWQTARAAALAVVSPAERRQALAELREERRGRRASGQYFDTRSSIVAYYLHAELDRRGWLARRWPQVPRGEASMSGRRWGILNDGTLTSALAVHVPSADGELLRRATWKVSAPATRKLQRLALMGDELPPALALQQARLRAQVVTTAAVIRAAVTEALNSWHSSD